MPRFSVSVSFASSTFGEVLPPTVVAQAHSVAVKFVASVEIGFRVRVLIAGLTTVVCVRGRERG